MITEPEKTVYEILEKQGIAYIRYEHPPVYTIEQAELYWAGISGAHCKNLFLRNKKGNHHYLVVLLGSKKADLRRLERQLGEDRLSFGSAERLKQYLGLEPGAVSPFGLINDAGKVARVIIDEDLKTYDRVNFHPNVNTATISFSLADFEKFLAFCGNTLRYIKI